MGGLGFKKLEHEQGIESINHIISTYDSPLPTSNLFKQSLEYIQLEVGIDNPVLISSFNHYQHLVTKGWVHSV
jgi:hypothetical protein